MSFVIVSAADEKSVVSIKGFIDKYPDLYIAQLDGKLFLMKNNGLSLALAWKLKEMHKGWIDIYISDRITNSHFPEKVKRVGQYLVRHSRGVSLESAIKKCGLTKEELKRQKIDYWPTLKEE